MLIEDIENTTKISSDKLKTLLKSDYSQALSSFKKGNIIFKGMSKIDHEIHLLNPIVDRKSKNTSNHYTMWVNNHDSWSEFPKRSVICTTNFKYAIQFGKPYIILPKNNSKLAMCPTFDFWESFGYEVSANVFIEEVSEMFSYMGLEPNPESYDEMIKQFRYFDSIKDKSIHLEYVAISNDMKEHIIEYGIESLFEKYFSTKRFKLMDIENFNAQTNREVWFNDQFLAIPHSIDMMQYLENF